MTLWTGNGAVLKSSSQWHLKEFLKLNNSVNEPLEVITVPSKYCNGTLPVPGLTNRVNHST